MIAQTSASVQDLASRIDVSEEAIQSIVDYINENQISDAILLGHSYGGMIITGVADRIPESIHRLIYWKCITCHHCLPH